MANRKSEPKVLARSVTVTNPTTRQTVSFTKGDVLPEWAEPLVTNRRAFEADTPPYASGGNVARASMSDADVAQAVEAERVRITALAQAEIAVRDAEQRRLREQVEALTAANDEQRVAADAERAAAAAEIARLTGELETVNTALAEATGPPAPAEGDGGKGKTSKEG